MQNPRSCYGKMSPSTVTVDPVRRDPGKVFRYRVDRPYAPVSDRPETANREAWLECTSCPDFDTFYRLSVATLLMEIAQKL